MNSDIRTAIENLDVWFDSMRGEWPTPGYGGPVVHWWKHQTAYLGTGLDWRYEGIINGYVTLWQRDHTDYWLEKALRAGDDLAAGQDESGHFRNSRFEQNPGEGGTPHEAAADAGLLCLARALRPFDPAASRRFQTVAEKNLTSYYCDRLWNTKTSTLWDSPSIDSFVPNKAATFVDAVLLLAELTNDPWLVETYAVPTAVRICEMQMSSPGEFLHGAIAQNRFGDEVVDAYFPLYVARCIPPLLALAERTVDDRLQNAAVDAARFLDRCRNEDGSFPQVVYGNGRSNDYPRWIAGTGDIIRALSAANRFGARIAIEPTLEWLMGGIREDGRIAAAVGFGRIMPILSRKDAALGDIGVVGWCDKAFRALADMVNEKDPDEGLLAESVALAAQEST